jgi:hypothetical protein
LKEQQSEQQHFLSPPQNQAVAGVGQDNSFVLCVKTAFLQSFPKVAVSTRERKRRQNVAMAGLLALSGIQVAGKLQILHSAQRTVGGFNSHLLLPLVVSSP